MGETSDVHGPCEPILSVRLARRFSEIQRELGVHYDEANAMIAAHEHQELKRRCKLDAVISALRNENRQLRDRLQSGQDVACPPPAIPGALQEDHELQQAARQPNSAFGNERSSGAWQDNDKGEELELETLSVPEDESHGELCTEPRDYTEPHSKQQKTMKEELINKSISSSSASSEGEWWKDTPNAGAAAVHPEDSAEIPTLHVVPPALSPEPVSSLESRRSLLLHRHVRLSRAQSPGPKRRARKSMTAPSTDVASLARRATRKSKLRAAVQTGVATVCPQTPACENEQRLAKTLLESRDLLVPADGVTPHHLDNADGLPQKEQFGAQDSSARSRQTCRGSLLYAQTAAEGCAGKTNAVEEVTEENMDTDMTQHSDDTTHVFSHNFEVLDVWSDELCRCDPCREKQDKASSAARLCRTLRVLRSRRSRIVL